MPVVQTTHVPSGTQRIQLAALDTQDKMILQKGIDRQLELVSHAVLRGKQLPAPGDTPISLAPLDLQVLREANMARSLGSTHSTSLQAAAAPSFFETVFGTLDYARMLLPLLDLLDMRSLAAVSRTCRHIVGSGRVCCTSWCADGYVNVKLTVS